MHEQRPLHESPSQEPIHLPGSALGQQPSSAMSPEANEAEPRAGPRLYVASLTDYNHGLLHGAWIDAEPDPAIMQTRIDHMLSESPTATTYGEAAEEWAIHDYDGFGQLHLGEYEPLTSIAHVAAGIAEHGLAFAAWAETVGLQDAELASFQDHYHGEWDSLEAFAEDLLDQTEAAQLLTSAPDWLQPYLTLDVAGFARDLQLNGDFQTIPRPDGGVWVFAGQ